MALIYLRVLKLSSENESKTGFESQYFQRIVKIYFNMRKSVLKDLEKTGTKLVAVSKTRPIEIIQKMYDDGQRIFGENRVQELVEKHAALPKDIEWHLIGHLQTNKVKYIAPFVSLIHSIDSFKLLKEVNKQAAKNERIIDVLLQFHVAKEDSKFGLKLEDAEVILNSDDFQNLKNIRVIGVMGMATFTSDNQQVRAEFQRTKAIFDSLKNGFFANANHFKEISMGMSGDYKIACEEGSTMVRVGSLLFK